MKKIWINKTRSFKQAEKFNKDYYFKMSQAQRLETMQFLRDMYFNIKGVLKNEGRKRLRRIIKTIQ